MYVNASRASSSGSSIWLVQVQLCSSADCYMDGWIASTLDCF